MFVQLALICFPHIIDCLFRQILTAILLDSEEDFILFFERRRSFLMKKTPHQQGLPFNERSVQDKETIVRPYGSRFRASFL